MMPANDAQAPEVAGQQKSRSPRTGPDLRPTWLKWRGEDLNLRPSGYESLINRPQPLSRSVLKSARIGLNRDYLGDRP